ncbi:PAS domain-containing sensor histidine kinase [Arcobacter sp. LA11]|uniref:PAS domain-containing sensor histidine kinase n=1 Tax=Arcobacter sp. LA11 TaxID=1898176 RepID=UPI0009345AA3|nr:PAS domain-containing sensor histidine kinase [Arcobacter sp. LA11]
MSIEDIEKLKRNNQELQEIINNSWDGIGIIDKSTKFVYVNNAFMPILGFSREELIKKNFVSLMEDKYVRSFLKLLVIKNKEKKYQAEIDIVCIRKDEKKVYLKITISSMLNKNLFVINTKDITQQVSDDEILDDYVISMHTDLHGHITRVSSAFLKLSEYKKKDIIGKPYSSLAHKDTNSIIYKNINKSLQNLQEWSGKLKNIKKDGTPFWINMKIKPMYNKYGDVTGYTSLMFDITNEINLNDEASMLQNQVSTAKEEIEQKDTLLIQQSKLSVMTETLQRLSHEWRQPLNLISIQAQKLELDFTIDEAPSTDNVVSTLEKIKDEANSLSSIIEDFQRFLQPRTKKELTKPSVIVEKVLEIFSKDENLNIELIKNIENDLKFESYAEEIITVLTNIINNSKEAIQKNSVENGIINIKQYFLEDTIYFEIYDNGGGIDKDIIHKIFEPYFSTKEQKHGVGLGLYTTKLIINMHLNGVISVTNQDDGVIFKISIPLN